MSEPKSRIEQAVEMIARVAAALIARGEAEKERCAAVALLAAGDALATMAESFRPPQERRPATLPASQDGTAGNHGSDPRGAKSDGAGQPPSPGGDPCFEGQSGQAVEAPAACDCGRRSHAYSPHSGGVRM